VVRQGETAWTIAARYGLTLDELLNLNGLSRGTSLQPGDKLLIRRPEPSTTPPPPTQAAMVSTQTPTASPVPTGTTPSPSPSVAARPVSIQTATPGVAVKVDTTAPNIARQIAAFPAVVVAGLLVALLIGIVIIRRGH
jgi:LysM domain